MTSKSTLAKYIPQLRGEVWQALAITKKNQVKTENLIRVSIITQFYPPDYAATGQLLSELATHLSKLGIEIYLFTGQPGYAFDKNSAPVQESSKQLSIRRTRTSRIWPRRIRGRALNGLLFSARAVLHLLRSANRGEVLLLTTEPPYLTVVGYLLHLLLGVPYVCLLYDIYPDIAVELGVLPTDNWLIRAWHWLNRRIWQQAESIIVLSSTMKERVLSHCPEVEPKINIIHSWADPEWIIPIAKQDNWFAHKYNLVDRFTVMYSGNMGRCHDMDTILAAMVELKDEPIQFVFIGAGAKRQPLIDQVEALGLTNCLFLPYQDKSVLPYSLTACDLSLVSVSEGMAGLVAPSKLYGILASARPVAAICEPHSYLRQMLEEANCGKAFDNGDAINLAKFIRQLTAHQNLAEKLGCAGRAYLRAKFTPEKIAQQYFQVLQQASQDVQN